MDMNQGLRWHDHLIIASIASRAKQSGTQWFGYRSLAADYRRSKKLILVMPRDQAFATPVARGHRS
jgi:hypothetical protein